MTNTEKVEKNLGIDISSYHFSAVNVLKLVRKNPATSRMQNKVKR